MCTTHCVDLFNTNFLLLFFVHFTATTIERKHYTSSIDLLIVMKTRFHIVPVSLCVYLKNRLLSGQKHCLDRVTCPKNSREEGRGFLFLPPPLSIRKKIAFFLKIEPNKKKFETRPIFLRQVGLP